MLRNSNYVYIRDRGNLELGERKVIIPVEAKKKAHLSGLIVPVQSIKISHSNLNVSLSKTTTFKATVTPSNATNQEIIWAPSDESIATIDGNGKVTPKAVGKTIITAKSSSGKTATSSDYCKRL